MEGLKLAFLTAIVVSLGYTGAAPRPEISGFIHGGQGSFYDAKTGRVRVSQYFFSPETNEWLPANDTCPQLFPGGHLISIERRDEWEHVKTLLDRLVPGQTYWTSGHYSGSIWHWLDGTPIDHSWAPWAPPHPTFPTLSKVVVHHKAPGEFDWLTTFDATRLRYICEFETDPDPTEPVPCYETNDLIVVLDSSGSIGAPNYEIAKDFVAKLVGAFNVHLQSREGLTIYSNTPTVILPLTHPYTPPVVDSIIRGIIYPEGGTQTAEAIANVRTQFLADGRGVPMNMLVLTDGLSADPAATALQAAAARTEGIVTYSLGIGLTVDGAELLAIAGHPDRVFQTDDFDQLLTLLRPVSEGICPRSINDNRSRL